jgi:hypothetical protein
MTMSNAGADATPLLPWEKKATDEVTAETSLNALAASLFEDEASPEETPEVANESEAEEPEEGEPAAPEAADDGSEEAQSEEGEEPEEGEESEDEHGEDPVYEVKVAGQSQKVPLSELLKGYSRTEDYTRKTQALATERKAFEQESAQTRELRTQYQNDLALLTQALERQAEQEPDWQALRDRNPTEFAVKWAEKQQRDEQLAVLQSQQATLQQAELAELQQVQQARLFEEHTKLVEAIPEWRDEAKASAGKQALREYAQQTYGFSDDDLATVADHRVLVMLRKAMLFDQQLANGQNVVREKKASAVLKPGVAAPQKSRRQRDSEKELQRARQDLRTTGREDAAARVFRQFID